MSDQILAITYSLYYRYSLNVVEAVKYCIFHELAHVAGLREGMAKKFAAEMILESRKAARGLTATCSKDFFADFNEEFNNSDSISVLIFLPPAGFKHRDLDL